MLDLGSSTGLMAKILVEFVGSERLVVAIDPDKEQTEWQGESIRPATWSSLKDLQMLFQEETTTWSSAITSSIGAMTDMQPSLTLPGS